MTATSISPHRLLDYPFVMSPYFLKCTFLKLFLRRFLWILSHAFKISNIDWNERKKRYPCSNLDALRPGCLVFFEWGVSFFAPPEFLYLLLGQEASQLGPYKRVPFALDQ